VLTLPFARSLRIIPTPLNELATPNIFVAAVLIALVHAVLPNHWLPFVLIGKTQRWSRPKIFLVLGLAGGGHMLVTALLGLGVAWLGKQIWQHREWLSVPLTSGLLILIGGWYVLRGIRHKHHIHGPHERGTAGVAAVSLFLMLTFSPCEAIVPLFFAASPMGWPTLVALAFLTAITSLVAIAILTYVALLGYEKIQFPWLDRNEGWVVGAILALLGASVLIIH
jgi:nickel/cobalt exporter